MKFVYIGSVESTETLGYKFIRNGDAVDVKEEKAVKKLQGNKCFKEVKSTRKAKAKTQTPSFE